MSNENKAKHTCCAILRNSDPWSRIKKPCAKTASIERDGRHYCKMHDPVSKQEKRDASYLAWQQKNNIQMEESRRQRDCVAACEGIANPAEAIRLAREALQTAKTHAEYCTDPVLRKSINEAISQLTTNAM